MFGDLIHAALHRTKCSVSQSTLLRNTNESRYERNSAESVIEPEQVRSGVLYYLGVQPGHDSHRYLTNIDNRLRSYLKTILLKTTEEYLETSD